MKKSGLAKMLALVLSLMLVLSGCGLQEMVSQWNIWSGPGGSQGGIRGGNGGTGGGTASTRRTIPYDEMIYERPDGEGIQARLEELVELAASAESFGKLAEYDYEVGALMEHFSTMRTLATLHSYHDANDTYYEEEMRYCEDIAVPLWNRVNEFNKVLMEGTYAEQYRAEIGDYIYEYLQNSLLLDSAEVEGLKQERNQLSVDYNQRLAKLQDEYSGDLATMYEDNAEEFTEYYRRMVEIDKEMASMLGFESAADMYYISYARDYTPEDARQYLTYSKEIFVPLASELMNHYSFGSSSVALQDMMDTMPTALATISDEMVDAWDLMVDNGLYDLADSSGKKPGAFTTYIDGYDAPYLFVNWDDDFSSTVTVMHEFGHYYDFWLRHEESAVQNLDVAEVYSQALELLMQENFSMFTNKVSQEMGNQLIDMTNPLTFQAMLEEFQLTVYEMDTFDAQTIAKLYGDLLKEYDLDYYYGYVDPATGEDYSWYRVTHFFDAPFYTISYWTSAVVALQIWAESLDNWDTGVQLYLDMIHANQNQPFTQLVESVGLRAPGNKDALQDIADGMAAAFGL